MAIVPATATPLSHPCSAQSPRWTVKKLLKAALLGALIFPAGNQLLMEGRYGRLRHRVSHLSASEQPSKNPAMDLVRQDQTYYKSLGFRMRDDLCANLKEEDWDRMTDQEKIDLESYSTDNRCDSYGTIIINRVKNAFHTVAEKLGGAKPYLRLDKHAKSSPTRIPHADDSLMKIDASNGIEMSRETALALAGWQNPRIFRDRFSRVYDQQELHGMLAHEMGHSALDHVHKRIAFILSLVGIQVESLPDASAFAKSFDSLFQTLPESESGRRLVSQFLEVAKKMEGYSSLSNERAGHRLWLDLEMRAISLFPEFYRAQEVEADLFTLKDPHLARGLRDCMANHVAYEGARCRLLEPDNVNCLDEIYMDSPMHPSLNSREQYMTRELCAKYPETNRDICLSDK